jgi:hypothetical protein
MAFGHGTAGLLRISRKNGDAEGGSGSMGCWLIFGLTAFAIPVVLFLGDASEKSKHDNDEDHWWRSIR